jgi:hypothetical protein
VRLPASGAHTQRRRARDGGAQRRCRRGASATGGRSYVNAGRRRHAGVAWPHQSALAPVRLARGGRRRQCVESVGVTLSAGERYRDAATMRARGGAETRARRATAKHRDGSRTGVDAVQLRSNMAPTRTRRGLEDETADVGCSGSASAGRRCVAGGRRIRTSRRALRVITSADPHRRVTAPMWATRNGNEAWSGG